MATYRKRANGKHQFIIRRKGQPNISKTFEKKAVGQRWANEIESQIDQGKYQDFSDGRKELFGDMCDRYRQQIIDPMEKGPSRTADESRLATLKEHFGKMTAEVVAGGVDPPF